MCVRSAHRPRQTVAPVCEFDGRGGQLEQLAQRGMPHPRVRYPVPGQRTARVDVGQQQCHTRTAQHHHHGPGARIMVFAAHDRQERRRGDRRRVHFCHSHAIWR